MKIMQTEEYKIRHSCSLYGGVQITKKDPKTEINYCWFQVFLRSFVTLHFVCENLPG